MAFVSPLNVQTGRGGSVLHAANDHQAIECLLEFAAMDVLAVDLL